MGCQEESKNIKYLKYKDYFLLWFLLGGTLFLAISWPFKNRINLEDDIYHPKINRLNTVNVTQKEPQIDLNRDKFEKILKISGVGPVLARRIVSDRERHGPYRDWDDLLRVKGVGPKKLARIRKEAHLGLPLESSP